jgi:PAS domain S-box-containing protein
MESQQLIESVLGGGGEMGERMRAFDWSTTALGPLEQWPQSLRICVRIILGSGYPMTIYWGPQYTMLYNDACRHVMGTKDPEALGHGFREIFPEMWDSVGSLFDRVMTDGQDHSTLTDQLFLLNRNNYLEECYFAVSFSPIPDDTGEVGGVLGTSLETTERVIEDRRRQVLRDVASRTAEARYEDEVWRVSADTLGEHRLTIPFAFLYAYRATDRHAYLVGPSVEPDALDPSVIDCTRKNLWGFDNALTSEGVVIALGPHASVLPSINWPVPPEQAAVVPIRLREESDAAGFLVLGIHPGRAFDETYRQFVRRIAEQIAIGLASARAYEQERQRADALAEIDRAKTAFFGNVSHEFRTPLQLILGPLEDVLPEAGERLGPERHRQLLTVRRNALRLLKLVNALLDFSRLEAGRLQAVYQPTDLAGLTSDIASGFHSAMDRAGLQFSVDCQPLAEPVFVDRDMWEKVVLNLLSNAFKFTFAGEVAISLKTVGRAVELQVRDTGVGIPDDQRENVFERFHRLERTSARTHEGTGIGLALVQELVNLHGGSVAVKSAVGFGSTFTVTIPRGKEHLPAESIQPEQSFASSQIRADAYVEEAQRWLPDASSASVDAAMFPKPSSLGSSRAAVLGAKRDVIVLADDNADMREYLSRLLGDAYEVHAVADGQHALEASRQLRPALVLADVMMPRLDGFELLRAIRDDSVLCSTPVILVSARAGEESRVEGLQADADDYLVKPFTSRELLARVATHVKMAHLRRVTAEREERLRHEAELQRQKLHASQELLAQTSRLYRDLGERERESRMIVNSIPGLVATLTPTGEVEAVTEQVIAYCGQTLEELKQWGTNDTVHPDDLPRVIETISNSIKSGEPYEIVHRIRRLDGVYRWFQVRGLPLRGSNGSIVRWYLLLTDIDDLKCAEALLAGEKRLLEMVASGSPLPMILDALCVLVEETASGCHCSILLIDSTGTVVQHGAGPSLPSSYNEAMHGRPVHPQAGPCGMAAYLKTQVIASDVAADTRWDAFGWRALALAHDLKSCWSTPVLSLTGNVLGTFAIYWHEAGSPTALHRSLIERFTHVASIAIERAISESEQRRADAEIRTLKDQLYQENLVLREEVDRTSMFEEIVGTSPALQPVLTRVAKVARTNSTVLITGETGTGKELVARAIHRRSARASRAFVSVNCAAVPRELITSELFGHEKGAFTGATQRRLGRFELAHGGTIFLDEVGELPMETQVALLRVLQEREFDRVGGSTSIRADVRVVTATNRDLQAAIEAGTFRSDLFYRLNVFPIAVPPLRERADDIPLLVEYFIDRFARKAGKTIRRVNKRTLDHLRSYPWPGNVRELQNVIERSVIVCDTDEFTVDESWLSARPAIEGRLALSGSIAAHEKAIIEDALRASGGRVFGPAGAAARLGIPRSTLESKIRALRINKSRFQARPAKS